jgi:O-phospho-L-seryl-tRNASec:L-selenocysteinyl-tRNA synthase
MINQGHAFGSIDLVVQSTDKNFLVPVGGSIVFGYEKEIV